MALVELTGGERKLTYNCLYCCGHPAWDLWEIDISRGLDKEIIQQWQLKCKGPKCCFSTSYSQDKLKVIDIWNQLMSDIYDYITSAKALGE